MCIKQSINDSNRQLSNAVPSLAVLNFLIFKKYLNTRKEQYMETENPEQEWTRMNIFKLN